jgi:hypothetical protein
MQRNVAIGLIVGAFIAGVLFGRFAWESVFGYATGKECVLKEERRVNWGGNGSTEAQDQVRNAIWDYCQLLFPEGFHL